MHGAKIKKALESPSLISYSGERFQLDAAFEGPCGSKNKQASKQASKRKKEKRRKKTKFLNVNSCLGNQLRVLRSSAGWFCWETVEKKIVFNK